MLFGFVAQLILFSKFANRYSMVDLVNTVSAALMLTALTRIKRLIKSEKAWDCNGDITYVCHLIFFVSLGFIDGLVFAVNLF